MTLDHLHPVLDRIRETQLGQTGVLRDIAETMQALAQQNARYGQELRMLRHEQLTLKTMLASTASTRTPSSAKPAEKSLWSIFLEAGEQRVLKWIVVIGASIYLAKGGDPSTLISWFLKPL